ncbi:helix-turn-helix transcriptional regulator [Marinibacterium profundimaris]|uniref:DeoR family transcriptional regulator n=1 Tax=Marinibacterium profundimaris TaxID=1679460 RepID=A0A225NXQ9_9RHOB|nr:YafY family protein [Marinibacterium profundimaris]OWU77948.1 DeoR family transcriptional regulator [Marinibacterium profundimaris]
MRRADRLFEIIQHLRGGRRTTARALADALEVSPRTIYRDIADLMATGVPISGEAGFGYVMEAGHDIPPLMFTRDEIVALVAGARIARAWGGVTMARAAEEALIKISEVLPPDARTQAQAVEIHSFSPGMTHEVRERIDAIEAAVSDRASLRLSYADAAGTPSERVIRPLGLWFWGKVWTLIAWCELREDFRMFRLDRIVSMARTGVRFKLENDKTLRAFYAAMEAQGLRPGPNG